MKLSWSFLKIITLLCTQLMVHVGGEHVQSQRRSTKDGLEKIENLKATGTSDTNVTIRWKLPNQKIRHFEVIVKVNEFLGCSDRNEPSPASQPIVRNATAKAEELSFEGLHPYTNYTTTVIAYSIDHEGFKGELHFTTLQRNIPIEKIQNLRYDASKDKLTWDAPNCADMTGPWARTNISFAKNGRYVSGKSVSSDTLQINLQHVDKLKAYTTYKVRAYIVRSTKTPDESAAHSEEINAKRPAAPPGKVNKVEAFNIDVEKRTISFLWDLPDPLNGEIESYHLEINHGEDKMPLLDETYKTPEQVSKCKLWEEFVCLENVRLETNFSGQLRAKISAKNKDVEEHGSVAVDIVLESDWRNTYFKPPSHLNETIEDDGLVTVRWRHLSRPILKIARFKIEAKLLESTLLNHTQNTRKAIYPVKQEQKEYNQLFYLTTSSRYNISVIAESEQKTHIGIVDSYDLRVPFQAGFASGKKVQLACNGTIRELEIPAIVNATKNTTVFITTVRKINQISREELSLNYKVENVKPRQLTLNFSQKYNITNNSAENEVYQIIVIATDLETGENTTIETTEHLTCNSAISLIPVANQLPIVGPVMICLIIIAILLVSFLVWYRKKKKLSSPGNCGVCIDPQSEKNTSTHNSLALHSLEESAAQSDIFEEEEVMHEYAVPNGLISNYVSVPLFQEYAKDAVISGRLHSEFEKLPRGTTKRCEYGKVPENVTKNRCVKQIPYDETRVILNRILGDPYSDYINASHIQGYGKRAYIAAQGPMPNTVDDFWRMIWQKNVRVICMLTNVVEDDETMCEQYWPDVRTTTEYGDVVVANVEHQVYANYTFRTFHLNYGTITRKVMHLHYTGWPSQGVPKDPQPLVKYLEKLMKTPVGDGPVLIHCSTGDGRTGVVMLCDICIREAAIANVIDVAGVTHRMRKSRAMMVSTQQQYNLAHVVIAKSVSEPSTSVECNEHLLQSVDKMRKRLPTDIKRLDDTEWHEQALFSGDAYQPPNFNESTEENRNGNHSGLYLELKNPCNYTNAVSVDGLSMKREYLASPLPSPTTLSEFWRFVIGDGVKLVIVLQPADPKNLIQCDIIPSKMTVGFAPDMQVETKTRFFDESYVKHELLVTDTSAKGARPHALTVLTCVGWKGDENGKRPAPATLLTIWRTSENIQRDKGQTLVLCRDGITGCGLYLAMSFLLERMVVERVCDVISAVRAVRRSRTEFVRSYEEFEYLYDAALTYAKCFECYANFT